MGTAILAFDRYEQTCTGRSERGDETFIGFHGFQQGTHGNGFGVAVGGIQYATCGSRSVESEHVREYDHTMLLQQAGSLFKRGSIIFGVAATTIKSYVRRSNAAETR